MAVDELSEPLSPQRRSAKAAGKQQAAGKTGSARAAKWSVAALILTAAVATLWIVLRNDPLGGEPVVVLNMETPAQQSGGQDGNGDLAFRTGMSPADGGGADSGVAIITRLDNGNVDISMPGSGGALGGTASSAGGDTATHPAASGSPSADPRIIEQAVIGMLPRIGNNGERPSEIYAKPAHLSAVIGSEEPARIALMIGGLGISASITDEAIARLPEAVTLAFAPYGRDLQQRVDQARRSGHEIMLQLPMEPFDYPDNDPGPHTLLAGASNSDNLERLYWLMARFTGYFGVTNYMGAKFTSDAEAIRPIQNELEKRGLALLDDGSSQRSMLAAAPAQGSSAARADIVIDIAQSRQEIAAALAQLEALARERGYAIGSGAALPATIDAVAEWASELETRGIVLVPVSAAMKSGQPS